VSRSASDDRAAIATALAADPATGAVTTSYMSQAAGSTAQNYTSWFDTAGVGNYFTDSAITPCGMGTPPIFYCPAAPLPLQANVTGAAGLGGPVAVPFIVGNDLTLSASANLAFSSLAATPPAFYGANAFVWGLPFFFNRTVFIVYPGASVMGASGALSGPFYAF